MKIIQELCMCYQGLNQTRATFRRHYYERHPSAKLSELNYEKVAGVLLNLLSSLMGKCFFCIQLRLDYNKEKQRYYVGLKRRGESIWVEHIHRIPLTICTFGYLWEDDQAVGDLSITKMRQAMEKADLHYLMQPEMSQPLT